MPAAPAGLDQVLAAARPGDTLVVPKLDRPASSVPVGHIGDSLVERRIRLEPGTMIYDPADDRAGAA